MKMSPRVLFDSIGAELDYIVIIFLKRSFGRMKLISSKLYIDLPNFGGINISDEYIKHESNIQI